MPRRHQREDLPSSRKCVLLNLAFVTKLRVIFRHQCIHRLCLSRVPNNLSTQVENGHPPQSHNLRAHVLRRNRWLLLYCPHRCILRPCRQRRLYLRRDSWHVPRCRRRGDKHHPRVFTHTDAAGANRTWEVGY